ncbi:MAG: GatB/YqeY domain-containing protein [Pseudomonadota bacterium]|nr:GatB/YqeY domain-containing protein [Pseudomonadota bacterium]
MSVRDHLSEAVKASLKAGDKRRVGALRLALAEIQRQEVDQRGSLPDEGAVQLLSKMVKQRCDSAAQFEQAERADLAEQERYEIAVLSAFLPRPLDAGELAALVDEALATTAAQDMSSMGAVMNWLRPRVQGRADMSAVSRLVRTRLK